MQNLSVLTDDEGNFDAFADTVHSHAHSAGGATLCTLTLPALAAYALVRSP